MKAVILAGGIGKRLRPITESVPKALVEVNGKPILERIIESLKGNGITDFVVVVSYLKEKIIDYFGDGSKFGVSITYVTQPQQLGTADSLRYAGPEIKEEKFLAVYGDLFFDPSIIRDALAEAEHTGRVWIQPLSIAYTHLRGLPIAPEGVEVRNPAFDVTPAKYVTAIITEKGFVRGDYENGLKALVGQ